MTSISSPSETPARTPVVVHWLENAATQCDGELQSSTPSANAATVHQAARQLLNIVHFMIATTMQQWNDDQRTLYCRHLEAAKHAIVLPHLPQTIINDNGTSCTIVMEQWSWHLEHVSACIHQILHALRDPSIATLPGMDAVHEGLCPPEGFAAAQRRQLLRKDDR